MKSSKRPPTVPELPAMYAYLPKDANPFVVLFVDAKRGLVVASEDHDRPIGYLSDHFWPCDDQKIWRRLAAGETVTLEN